MPATTPVTTLPPPVEDGPLPIAAEDGVPLWAYDPQTLRFVAVNEAALHRYGYTRHELAGLTYGDLLASFGDHPAADGETPPTAGIKKHRAKGGAVVVSACVGDVAVWDGRTVRLEVLAEPPPTAGVAWSVPRQRTELVGQLAAGVVHDLNNLLTIICVNTEMLAEDAPETSEERERLLQIADASRRAGSLTRRMLRFARASDRGPALVDVNEAADDVASLLRRALGPQISLRTRLTPGIGRVCVDPVELEQALVNLAVNARDAMPDGGVLTIETAPAEARLPPGSRVWGRVRAGPHVRVTVQDTGTGIPDVVQARMFEPFFTTKPLGEGTGLGLASVLAMVQGWRGHLGVASRPGQGTAFHLFIPSAPARSGA